MKYIKTLGLIAIIAAALGAFAVPASATELTSPLFTRYFGAIKLVSEGEIWFDNELGLGPMRCEWTLEGKVESQGAAETAKGQITGISFPNCTENVTPTVLKKTGSFEIHTEAPFANGNGTVTVSGIEFTLATGSYSCKWGAGAGIDFGTLTGSRNTGSNATLDVTGVTIPRVGDSPVCGEAATLTGSFKVESPTYLDVD